MGNVAVMVVEKAAAAMTAVIVTQINVLGCDLVQIECLNYLCMQLWVISLGESRKFEYYSKFRAEKMLMSK